MRLDRDTCIGGRLNKENITGIKINGYVIYPNITDCVIIYSYIDKPGEFSIVYFTDENSKEYYDYTYTDIKNGSSITRTVTFTKQDYLHLYAHDVYNISRLKGSFEHYRFDQNEYLESINLSETDTSNVTSMIRMFWRCPNLTSLDVSNFDTSNVTDMYQMFANCTKLTTIEGLENFDTSNVTSMKEMFYSCESLTSLNLSNFDMSNVKNTDYMFYDCYRLTELRLDNCNKDTINKIITSKGFMTATVESGDISITIRTIYCKRENVAGLTPPHCWRFIDCETGEEIITN